MTKIYFPFTTPRPLHNISLQSIHNFLSSLANGQSNRKQTERQTNATKKHNLLGGHNDAHLLVLKF